VSSKQLKPGEQSHPQPNQAGTQHNMCDVTGSIQVRGEIETKIPPDLAKKRDAAEEQKETRDKKRYILEVIGVIAVIMYAGITIYQAYLTRTQFTKEERPFVLVSEIRKIQFSVGKAVITDIKFSNSGKSPALHMATIGPGILVGPGAMQQVDATFANLPDTPPEERTEVGATIAPGNGSCIAKPEDDAVLDCVISTIHSREIIQSDDDLKWITTHDEAVVIMGRTFYRDLTGKLYKTDFCFFRFATGALAFCPNHNDVK
jgi:hypothetical protein